MEFELKHPISITEHNFSDSEEPYLIIVNWVYNNVNYVNESIKSILEQKTKFPVKIIIHDDASTDGSKEIILKYQNKYPNLFSNILQEENQYSNNVDITSLPFKYSGSSKYIALTHGDDFWTDPLKLQKQVDLMELTKSDFCYSDFDIFYQEKGEFQRNIFKNKLATINIKYPLLTRGSLGVPTWVFKTDFLKEFNPDKHKLIDKSVLMLLEFLRTNGKVCFIPESTTVYRRNLNSASNQEDSYKRYLHHKLSFEFMIDYFEQYYSNDIQSRNKINNLSINILSEAHDHQDLELINRIKMFLLDSEIDITQILLKFQERDKYKHNYESLENSKLIKLVNKFKKK